MKCRYCGHEIPNGQLHCGYCGKEVRIVPDYNPLDDVLAAQVKGSIDGTETPLDDYEYRRTRSTGTRNTRTSIERNTGSIDKKKPASSRKQMERKRALKKKRRNRMLVIMAAVFLAIVGIIFLLYQNSYTGQVRKGYKAINSREYSEAEGYFNKAISKKPKRAEAYTGLAQTYIAQGDRTKAEEVFLKAVDEYPNSVEIHEACIQFYVDVNENHKIPILLNDATDKVNNALSEYIIDTPSFSLDNEAIFDDVQQLTLSSTEDAIYYTVDGSDPTSKSTKFKDPIQLSEGETVVKAVSVNEEGIPSRVVSKTYTVEFPIEDAPAVSPSTGQYDEPTEITIIVPDGYTAYYTTDRSEPTEESEMYTGPIDMPEGSTIFKAVLVNSKGKLSGVTTRNYELTIEEE